MTDVKGSDGTIAREGNEVVLTFSGFTCQAQKKAVSPRRIPLSAIADVEVVPPKGLKTGHLRLVLAGDGEPEKPTVDVNTLLYGKGKAEAAIETFADELRGAIAGASAVPTEIAGPPVDPDKKPGFLARQQAAMEEQQKALRDSGVLFQGTSHESGRNSVVTLYADRLERVKAKKMSSLSNAAQETEVTPVRAVSSVQATKDGMAYTKVTVFASGNNIDFRFGHAEAQNFKNALMKLVLQGPPSAAPQAPAQPDVMAQLKKLGDLRDAGILSEEEFTAKKADLLSRL